MALALRQLNPIHKKGQWKKVLKKYLLSLPARSLSKNELFHSYFSRILNSSGVNAETKRKVDINCENSAQISIAAKNMVTQDDPELWLWDTNKLYAILLFHFFIIMFKSKFVLFEVALFDSFDSLWLKVCAKSVHQCSKQAVSAHAVFKRAGVFQNTS